MQRVELIVVFFFFPPHSDFTLFLSLSQNKTRRSRLNKKHGASVCCRALLSGNIQSSVLKWQRGTWNGATRLACSTFGASAPIRRDDATASFWCEGEAQTGFLPIESSHLLLADFVLSTQRDSSCETFGRTGKKQQQQENHQLQIPRLSKTALVFCRAVVSAVALQQEGSGFDSSMCLACSPWVCKGSLQVLLLPPTAQKDLHMRRTGKSKLSMGVECGCLSVVVSLAINWCLRCLQWRRSSGRKWMDAFSILIKMCMSTSTSSSFSCSHVVVHNSDVVKRIILAKTKIEGIETKIRPDQDHYWRYEEHRRPRQMDQKSQV